MNNNYYYGNGYNNNYYGNYYPPPPQPYARQPSKKQGINPKLFLGLNIAAAVSCLFMIFTFVHVPLAVKIIAEVIIFGLAVTTNVLYIKEKKVKTFAEVIRFIVGAIAILNLMFLFL